MTKRLFLALLIPSFLLAADNQPIISWGKTTWGMSLAEVRRAYPEAKAIPEDTRMKPELREASAKAEIEKYSIADDDYRVLFFFKPSVGLHEIDVTTHAKAKLDLRATKLQQLLTEKYGAPKLREPDEIGGVRLMWTTPTLTVVLTQTFYFGEYGLTIIYTAPTKAVLDKL